MQWGEILQQVAKCMTLHTAQCTHRSGAYHGASDLQKQTNIGAANAADVGPVMLRDPVGHVPEPRVHVAVHTQHGRGGVTWPCVG
jgi:hypothetical protein